MSFKIGICSPIRVDAFIEVLPHVNKSLLNLGIGGDAVNQIILGLLKKGYIIEVFTLDYKISEPVVLKGSNITINVFPMRRRLLLFDFFYREISFLSNAIKKSDVDIIHAHWSYEYAIAALKSRKKHVISVRDNARQVLKLFPDKVYRFMRLLMNEYVLFKGQSFIANSPYIESVIKNRTRGRVVVIPNSIREISPHIDLRQLNVSSPKLVSVNNGFSKAKNVHTLLRAFAIVRRMIPTARLILVGKGFDEGGEANRWAEQIGLCQGVSFLGLLGKKEVLELLANSDLLVHPSIEESFGNTLIEAMSQGTPCIGGAGSSAVPWVLNYGRAGCLTNVLDAHELGEAIVCILNDEAQWNSYSLAGIDNIKKRFLSDGVTREHIMFYRQILNR